MKFNNAPIVIEYRTGEISLASQWINVQKDIATLPTSWNADKFPRVHYGAVVDWDDDDSMPFLWEWFLNPKNFLSVRFGKVPGHSWFFLRYHFKPLRVRSDISYVFGNSGQR